LVDVQQEVTMGCLTGLGAPARVPSLLAALVCAALSFAFAGGVSAQDSGGTPGIERLVSLPTLSGTPPSRPAWSPDGSQVAFLWNNSGFPYRDLWLVEVGGEPRRLTNLNPGASTQPVFGEHLPEDTSLASLTRNSRQRHAGGIGDFVWSRDGRSLFFLHGGEVKAVDIATGEQRTVIAGAASRSRLGVAPDGSHLSFLQDGDLWLYRFEGDFLLQATRTGLPGIGSVPIGAYNDRDREFSRYVWSPDSRYIALEHVDRTGAHRMQIPSYLHPEPLMHEVRRVYPGHEGVSRRVGIYTLDQGVVSFLDLKEPLRRTIMTLDWSPSAPELLIEQDTYDGEQRWLMVADANAGEVREVHHDMRPRRIYSLFRSTWSRDGSRIIFIGDNEDYYRLYAVPADGGRVQRLTAGDFDVSGPGFSAPMLQVSAESGDVYFTTSAAGPSERQVYRVAADGGRATRVTQTPGTHEQAVLSPDGRFVASVASSDTVPGELYLTPTRGGEVQRVTRSPLPGFDKMPMARVRYVSFPSRIDDFILHARIVEPADLDPDKSYPVIIGNVYSSTARNQWSWPRPVNLLQHAMADDGDYITVQVDLRGSAGYGVDFREAFQGDWGGGDLHDLHSTVDYLKTLNYVDPERIGIWGNSYGGMMVLFALFERPGMFAAGVSGSPAIDVHYFTQNDQHLSRRPHTHPETFRDSTLLNYGEKLEDPLLIIHGLHDDIVPWKTTAAMIEKLMLLGKDFDMVVPPQSAHWWGYPEHYAVHTFRKLRAFFDRHVGAGARER
jgi:dipeptidyl-peptidase-4